MKDPTFRGGSRETNIEGGLPKKGRFGQFASLKGGLGKKEGGGVFKGGRGVDSPMHTMNIFHTF